MSVLSWSPMDSGYTPAEEHEAQLDALYSSYDEQREEPVAFKCDLDKEIRDIEAFLRSPPDTTLPAEILEASARLYRLVCLTDGRP